MSERLPLAIVTGFLGSGKTTLLRRFLQTGDGPATGLVVNEFGETGVDHRLYVHASEQVELLDRGCLCCARRADIGAALHTLVQRSRAGGTPFRRAVIETSGLADPAPIVATLARDPWLKAHIRLSCVVTVIDAVAGLRNIAEHDEARRQISIADTVVITKADMRAACPTEEVAHAVRAIAPDARVLDAQAPEFDVARLLDADPVHPAPRRSPLLADGVQHRAATGSFVIELADRVDWPCLTLWLSALLHAHGDRILRVKGVVRTAASRQPLVIHGVQHVMHPPSHLAEDDGTPSFLVFITRGLGRNAVAGSLDAFLRLGGFDQPGVGSITGAEVMPAASST